MMKFAALKNVGLIIVQQIWMVKGVWVMGLLELHVLPNHPMSSPTPQTKTVAKMNHFLYKIACPA